MINKAYYQVDITHTHTHIHCSTRAKLCAPRIAHESYREVGVTVAS